MKKIDMTKCYTTGCKAPVSHRVTQNWGVRRTYNVCDEHIPGSKLHLASEAVKELANAKQWYTTERLMQISLDMVTDFEVPNFYGEHNLVVMSVDENGINGWPVYTLRGTEADIRQYLNDFYTDADDEEVEYLMSTAEVAL